MGHCSSRIIYFSIDLISRWRRMRKAAHGGLNKTISSRYHPIQLTEAIILTTDVLNQPKVWLDHAHRSAASTITSVVYGTPPMTSKQDPLVKDVNDFVSCIASAAMPGAHLVEFFPWMINIPSSLAKWKRNAENGYRRFTDMFTELYTGVSARIVSAFGSYLFRSHHDLSRTRETNVRVLLQH